MARVMAIDPVAALRLLGARAAGAIVVPTMTTVAPWRALEAASIDVPCIGFMGGAAALGLGLALAQPTRRVLVLDGDGSLLMQLGGLATVAAQAPPGLHHFLFKNGIYHVSGGQSVPGGARVDFAAMARAAGYRRAHAFDTLAALAAELDGILAAPGPSFVELTTIPVEDPPRGGVIGASFAELADAAHRLLEAPPEGHDA